MAGIPQIPWEMRGNRDGCRGNTAGLEMGAAGIPHGTEFAFAGTLRDALEILQTIKIMVQVVDY